MTYSCLAGKSVVITGGASGIGLDTALRFAQEGAIVTVLDKDESKLANLLIDHPSIRYQIKTDVGDYELIKQTFEQIDQLVGKVDVLIANAGISIRSEFMNITFEQWNKVLLRYLVFSLKNNRAVNTR